MLYLNFSLHKYFPVLCNFDSTSVLTAYLPDNLVEVRRDEQARPCLLICPGGGYEFCSQREAEPIALHFLPEGFNVFVLTYSCAPHRFPTQLCEVAAAMELIYQNAEEWHCDTPRVAIMGFSAGGHLAAHYSNAYDCEEVRAVFPNSKPIQASLLCYPVITADPRWAHLGSFDNLTGSQHQANEEADRYSCEKLVCEQTPPTFLWHTAADTTVPVMNSLLYAQALASYGVPFELHIYPLGGHGLATCDRQAFDVLQPEISYAHAWLDCAKKWLKTIFKESD